LDQTDTNALKTEIERYKTIAKEEEEKRVKAVSLLKTVRQKLVKTEREKEDAFREVAVSRDRDRGEKETDRIERLKLQQELEMVQIEREKMATAQKAQFERELALQKERYEREMAAVKGQLELEIITLKVSVFCQCLPFSSDFGVGGPHGLSGWLRGWPLVVATQLRLLGYW
jgi:hypothetical protein